jgi:hypothetical protein
MTASSTLRPDGTTGPAIEMAALNAAGQPDGFSLWQFATNVWLGMRTTAGVWNPSIVMQRVGGGMYLESTFLDITTTAATNIETGGQFNIDSTGDQILIGANANNYLIVDGTSSQLVSAGGVKSFVIDHPTDPDRLLVHGCVEGPEAAVIYRGTAVLDDTNLAVVELPDYFTAATRPGSETVQLTAELATVRSGGKLRPMVVSAAPTRVEGGRFYIVAPGAPAGTRVHWTVMAQRADVAPFDVEPLRAAVEVRGDGPYRYIPSEAA